MKRIKRQLKKKLCLSHRKNQYLFAINGVIDGKFDPNYATLRWQKVKEVKGR